MYKNIHVPYPFTDNAKKIHRRLLNKLQSSSHLIAPDYDNQHSLPNEEEHEEFNQLQSRHHLLRFTWKSNYTAPLKAGAKVIDVA
ncbi:1460_t:CDS:2 [Funneliformis caledonium]|uniref:1460_t:CDS:1 n=1 Tax=Funneliformis caledonium TaxID=1117310 RepID=A0A9N9GUE8_9GLOM|nr:1460_t:CDS:2 [Funneliformis caledonium]